MLKQYEMFEDEDKFMIVTGMKPCNEIFLAALYLSFLCVYVRLCLNAAKIHSRSIYGWRIAG